MKKTKRRIALLLAGVLPAAASLAACDRAGAGDPPAELIPGEPTIGVAIFRFADTFMTAEREAISEAAEGLVNVDIVDSKNSQPKQNDIVDGFISKQYAAMAINPVDRTAAGVIIDKAKAAKVPVVFMNREPPADDMRKWDRIYYVGAKAEQSGTMEGELLADYWKSHPEADKNKDGVIQYVMLKGEPGHQDAELRTKFSVQALEDAGLQVEKLAEDTGMFDREKARAKMAAFYSAHGDKIEAVLANNDDMALGAIDALKDEGYFKYNKYMPVVGVDATAPALEALAEGTLLGTVINDAKAQGEATLSLANVLARGGTPSKENTGYDITDGKYVWIPYKKITKSNVQDAR
ncbi:galactose ABC transporter substrate-binding protein [Cohnella lubricantis]|uniref:D-galactose/methyl-galactoside binding periplasmic protein MglB n=1 Tax=Cohnella lubricantis TaxID=2163172 RepID=A0A841TKT3_9BACL|nr:galactose ABC transporter substrate-binding protein [Cohnella lubricantis]MBB6679798.1 galactose ABC transporter substrate-binding protein [Cohnella lubricantis]MBP2120261.1 methyl-galactoside transport system substrate-binding protein [Cohnella lubricantis]